MSAPNVPSSADGKGHGQPGSGDFEETERAETMLPYGEGRVPFYISIVWIAFIVGYVVYMVAFGLPDLKLWGAP